MSFIPLKPQEEKYHYSVGRFLDREFGIEYLDFELDQIQSFHAAKRQENEIEITGFVSWLKYPNFILLPSPTTANNYILCKVDENVEYPPDNQFIKIKGRWNYSLSHNNALAEKVLIVEHFEYSSPEYGRIKPEISSQQFRGKLFDRWINIDETTQNLISQSLVSSPTISDERAGGLTLTLANYTKQLSLRHFTNDLHRFIPQDLTNGKNLSFEVSELKIKHRLPIQGWFDHIANLDSIPKSIDSKLDRVSNDEYSITLLQDNRQPLDLNLRGLIKSDYPIILEQNIERKGINKDVDLEVYKYLLAVRLSAPAVSSELHNRSVEHCRNELLTFAENNEILKKLSSNDQFYDLGRRGKPLSVHNLAVSLGRSDSINTLTIENVEIACSTYMENLQYILNVQQDWLYDTIPQQASVNQEERNIYSFFNDRRQATIVECSEKLNVHYDECKKIVESLLRKSLLFDCGNGKYGAV